MADASDVKVPNADLVVVDRAKVSWTVRQRLDRLDDVFLFAQTIDRATAIDELDVEGILTFAEVVLPSAAHT